MRRVNASVSGHLRDVVGGTDYEFEIFDVNSPLFIGAIPQSTYDLLVTSPSGLPVFPAKKGPSRCIVGQELAEVEVHLDQMAGVHFLLPVIDGGSLSDGFLEVELVDERGGSSYFAFVRSPYNLSGLPPGRYRFVCTGPNIQRTEYVKSLVGGESIEVDLRF